MLSVIWFLRPAKIMFTMMRMLTMRPKVIMMFSMRILLYNDPAFYMTVPLLDLHQRNVGKLA